MSAKSKKIGLSLLVAAVALVAGLVVASLPASTSTSSTETWVVLLVLATLSGGLTVRIPGLSYQIAPSHPFIIVVLATLGPRAAALAAGLSVISATWVGRKHMSPMKVVFNVAATVLSSAAAAWAYLLLGGTVGLTLNDSIGPIAAAVLTYSVANTSLVALVISVAQRVSFVKNWASRFGWTATSYLSGLTIAVAMLAVIELTFVWILVLCAGPCWLLTLLYRTRAETETDTAEVQATAASGSGSRSADAA